MKRYNKIGVFGLMLISFMGYGQDEKDKLGTKVIDIVKSYSASILDARKIPQATPKKDTLALKKYEVRYSINSFPVASDYTPEKGKVIKYVPERRGGYYNSYVAFGGGTKSNLVGDAFIALPINEYSNISLDFGHNSSQKAVEGSVVDNNFSNTYGQFSYKFKELNYGLGASVSAGQRLHYLYGIEDRNFANNGKIDFSNNYTDAGARIYFDTNNSFLERIEFGYDFTKDKLSNSEHELKFNSDLSFEVGEQLLMIGLDANHQTRKDNSERELRNTYFGIKPNYNYIQDYLELNIGLGAYYVMGNDNKMRLFPNVDASYVLTDFFIPYAGIKGGVKQNTLKEKSKENAYMSEYLWFVPTFTQYDAYIGFRGSLQDYLNYTFRGHFGSIEDMAMFKFNYAERAWPKERYDFGNSFSMVYDKATVLGVSGGITANVTDVFTAGIEVLAEKYNTKTQKEAWNMPNVEIKFTTDLRVLKNWFIGGELSYMDKRKEAVADMKSMSYVNSVSKESYDFYGKNRVIEDDKVIELEEYWDINLRSDFTIAKQWTIFASVNNLLGNGYRHWHNYNTQGLQIIGGLKYQFKLEK